MADENIMKSRGREPNNYPMTFEQMVESNEARKPKKSDRRAILEANKTEISMLVGDLAKRLENQEETKTKVNLRDTERVKRISLEYIRSCQYTGTLPTMAGVSLALGCFSESLKVFILRNPGHETSQWFRVLKSHFADILNQAALAGDVAPIPAIFTLKASYNWNDQPEQEAKDNSETEDMTPDAIAAKYDDIPD